jgi:hypothetical protein
MNFKSRNVIVTRTKQYPQHIAVQFVQDKCDILNNYKEGQNVKKINQFTWSRMD